MANNTEQASRDHITQLVVKHFHAKTIDDAIAAIEDINAWHEEEVTRARINETERWRASGWLPLFDADKRISELESQSLKERKES